MINYDYNEFFTLVVLILLTGFVIGWGCGANWTDHQFKRQAVINKAANWVMDDTGTFEFKWNYKEEGE